ncbi:hypothetical protein ACSNOB_08260 [Micromonospora sp. URMC 106]|uniref:hypothetical protein n=1 Tax=Micromonospora sp. URMC 106 TaxID=3423408 RepID=UPI003F1B4DC8
MSAGSSTSAADAIPADPKEAVPASGTGSAVLAKGITELVISVPAAGGDTKAHGITVTTPTYGNATTAQKPPADKVVEAPAPTYEMPSNEPIRRGTGGSGRPFSRSRGQPTGATGQNGDCATRRQGTTGGRARPAAPATGARATQPTWCVARFPAAARCVG